MQPCAAEQALMTVTYLPFLVLKGLHAAVSGGTGLHDHNCTSLNPKSDTCVFLQGADYCMLQRRAWRQPTLFRHRMMATPTPWARLTEHAKRPLAGWKPTWMRTAASRIRSKQAGLSSFAIAAFETCTLVHMHILPAWMLHCTGYRQCF